MIDPDEVNIVALSMIKHGGSFVACLGRALGHADPINAQKIKDTWPTYWLKYLTDA